MSASRYTAYLAPIGYEKQLQSELQNKISVYGRLVLAKGAAQRSFWAQNIWYEPLEIKIRSIADGAKKLRSMQKSWACYSFKLHRRAKLIQQQLPRIAVRPLKFPSALPNSALGSWALLEQDTIIASAQCSSPFVNGEISFEESKSGPPNRAYLKLWEVFTRFQIAPKTGERCLDAGGSPGGWAWVLQSLGCNVHCIDRAPLAREVAGLRGITFRKGDAFAIKPVSESAAFDWIFWDVACHPKKLLSWIHCWIDSGRCAQFVCTLKFQGNMGYSIADEFLKISNSQIVHLCCNKHELTWVRTPKLNSR